MNKKDLKFNRISKDDDPAQWVQKIDDDSVFNAITTGVKTLTQLKKNAAGNLTKKYLQFWKLAREKKWTGENRKIKRKKAINAKNANLGDY